MLDGKTPLLVAYPTDEGLAQPHGVADLSQRHTLRLKVPNEVRGQIRLDLFSLCIHNVCFTLPNSCP